MSNDSDYIFNQNSATETTQSITDESGWTEKEKDLLNRGIEIFGKSNVRLAQFIGSKNASEVKYYLKNFYCEYIQTQKNIQNEVDLEKLLEGTPSSSITYSDIINDAEIPASIEEVIAAVTTAKPTIQTSKKKDKKMCKNITFKDVPSGQSLLKSNFVIHNQLSKEKKLKNVKKQIKACNENNFRKFKFKKQFEVLKRMRQPLVCSPCRKNKKEHIKVGEAEIITGNGQSVPVCTGEEVVGCFVCNFA